MAQTLKVKNGDIVTNAATGRFTLTTGSSKLSQDIQEFLSIHIQPNGFGAGIEQLVGIVESSIEMFTSITDRQIRDGLLTFIRLINQNPVIDRSPAEKIVGISSIQVGADPVDPTTFYFSINILTENGNATTVRSQINIS